MALRNIAQKEEELEISEGLRYTHPLIAAYHTAREKAEKDREELADIGKQLRRLGLELPPSRPVGVERVDEGKKKKDENTCTNTR